jgi:SAM-dependent methyltransferase
MSYLTANNEFYSREQLAAPRYRAPHPNAEEATRAAALLHYLGEIGERHARAGTRPRLLDAGCGRGWLTHLLSPFGDVEGIDPAPGAVERARQCFPDLGFHCGTLPDLLAGPVFEPFDVVVCSEVIEHVPHPLKADFVDQLRGALKPGGDLLLTTPRGRLLAAYRRKPNASLQPVEDWLTERRLERLFIGHGFVVEDHRRARPRRITAPSRLWLSSKLRRSLAALGLRALFPTLDHLASHYQVWWFRRR